MKRLIIFLILLGLFAGNMIFSQEEAETLIDFTEIVKNVKLEDQSEENKETLVYFGDEAGVGITEEIRNKMFASLVMDNWRVTLASSARTPSRQRMCMAKTVYTKKRGDSGAMENDVPVLGVRVKFPDGNFNSYALIEPPFEIQAYQPLHKEISGDTITKGDLQDDEADYKGSKFDNKGVLKNVGTIKSISAEIYGANYPHGFGVIIVDENYAERIYHLGYLNYEGWQTRTWENNNYITDVRDRELKQYPLYPRAVPYIKLLGFVVFRDAATLGGDFITYIKNVTVVYDDAVLEREDEEITHELEWGIIQNRNEKRRKVEYQRLGSRMLLEVMEKQKTVDAKKEQDATQ